jgi:D-beta-D-heptose 7-phosphate kinase/D-beta-D-heptose 1-phosphate adenosyltransferase
LTTHFVVVGDALLDKEIRGRVRRLCPDAPVPVVEEADALARPGGAGLAALLAARDGARVRLITAIGDDAAGDQLVTLLAAEGIDVVNVGLEGSTPQKIRIGTTDRSLLRLDLGDGRAHATTPDDLPIHFETARGVLVSDYGRGVATTPAVRHAIGRAARAVPVVWDPHPNGPPPVEGVRLATPNEEELLTVGGRRASGVPDLALAGQELRDRWRCASLCVTRGRLGAIFVEGSPTPLVVPAPTVENGDSCGAGDRFAATAALELAGGALASEAVVAAVRAASAFVGAGGARSVPIHARAERGDYIGEHAGQAARPAVVATGGCFDLLHAGHVALLQAAAGLGNRLIVFINSDASVRRLKGAGRPLVPQEDRAAVLRSIAGVDEVVVFDEDTPERVLEQFKPDLFVKGGDYAGAQLPESEVVARWGGRAVVLPYLEGRSTSALVKEAIRRAGL